jgi:hypothetical protein
MPLLGASSCSSSSSLRPIVTTHPTLNSLVMPLQATKCVAQQPKKESPVECACACAVVTTQMQCAPSPKARRSAGMFDTRRHGTGRGVLAFLCAAARVPDPARQKIGKGSTAGLNTFTLKHTHETRCEWPAAAGQQLCAQAHLQYHTCASTLRCWPGWRLTPLRRTRESSLCSPRSTSSGFFAPFFQPEGLR